MIDPDCDCDSEPDPGTSSYNNKSRFDGRSPIVVGLSQSHAF